MATVAGRFSFRERRPDLLSGTPRAGFVDRWIYVFMAALFVVIILAGFIPDSIMKIAMVESGQRPPFPIVLHMHAVLMGSFMLLLLTQTTLVATGRCALHMKVGLAAFVLAPALVVVGFVLAPTMYHETWNALAQTTNPEAREKLEQLLARKENILLVQSRIGLLFPLFLGIGLGARKANSGLHKRMMILAPALALGASIDRMTWLPNTMPVSPLGTDFYIFAAVLPMFLWDVFRNRRVHEAYLVWFAIWLPVTLGVYALWNTPAWHATARHIMGV